MAKLVPIEIKLADLEEVKAAIAELKDARDVAIAERDAALTELAVLRQMLGSQ